MSQLLGCKPNKTVNGQILVVFSGKIYYVWIMNTTLYFDPLKLARGLEEAGFEHEQALKTAEVLANNLSNETVAREYLDAKFEELENRISDRVDKKLSELQINIMKWVVPVMLGQTAILAALIKLF
jgi:uncharacterized protein Smg (DUF494 family)